MGKRRDDSICVSHGSPSGVGTRVPLERARTRCDPLPETLLRGHSGTSRTGPCYSSCGTSAARLRHVCGTTRGGPMDASNAGQGDQQLQRRGAATRRDEGGLDHRRRQRGPPTGFGLQGSRRRAQAIAALSPRRRGLLNVGPDELERQLRERFDALPPAARAELLQRPHAARLRPRRPDRLVLGPESRTVTSATPAARLSA